MRNLFLIALLTVSYFSFAQSDSTKSVVTKPAKEVFIAVEVMPEFPGGEAEMMKFISGNLVYPKMARDSSIEGTVRIKFIIEADGSVTNAVAINKNKLGFGCEEAAIATILKMPKWRPGKQNGKPVSVYFNLPIRFKLY